MSDTSKTRTRRNQRKANMGKARKKKLAKDGTTPPFPVHPEGKASEAKAPATS
ncbi:MAG: hypothetical protein AAF447_10560 [Myxococcota bacterium]